MFKSTDLYYNNTLVSTFTMVTSLFRRAVPRAKFRDVFVLYIDDMFDFVNATFDHVNVKFSHVKVAFGNVKVKYAKSTQSFAKSTRSFASKQSLARSTHALA